MACCLALLDDSAQFGSSPVIIKCCEELLYLPVWMTAGNVTPLVTVNVTIGLVILDVIKVEAICANVPVRIL